MPDLTDPILVANETPATIKSRLIADTNAGVDPSDAAYIDAIFGSFWDDLNGAAALEIDRLYDRLNEAIAAAIPATSFGAFLDEWAASLGTERKAAAFAGGQVEFTGPATTVIPNGAQVSTGSTSVDSDPVAFLTTAGGTIDSGGVLSLDVIAATAGADGNVAANTVVNLDTPLGAVTVRNPLALTGGADVESDEALAGRVLRKLAGATGGGNAEDYIDWGLGYPGVGFVTVQANTPSLGHVTVLITDVANDPMPSFAVSGLQDQLDPSTSVAQGAGLAPVGATVHVATPTSRAIAVAATVQLATGYSLDGISGTQATRPALVASLQRYVDGLPVGGDVTANKVLAALIDVQGVQDVTALTLNGGTGSVAVAATEVASLTLPPTLTAV